MENYKFFFFKQLENTPKLQPFLKLFSGILEHNLKFNLKLPIKITELLKNKLFSQYISTDNEIEKEILNTFKDWTINLDEHVPCFENKVLTPLILEEIYEYEKKVDDKEKGGSVNTPKPIASAMVDFVIDEWLKNQLKDNLSFVPNLFQNNSIEEIIISLCNQLIRAEINTIHSSVIDLNIRLTELLLNDLFVLDPCAGTGIFIITLIEKILSLLSQSYHFFWLRQHSINNFSDSNNWESIQDLNKMKTNYFGDFHNFIPTENLQQFQSDFITDFINFIIKNIKMLDISESALKIAQIRAKAMILNQFGSEIFFKSQVIEIQSDIVDSLFTDWKENQRPFNCIIGNPPYVSSDSMAKYYSHEELEHLKLNFKSCIKKGSKPDLFFYFIQKSLDQLPLNGWLAFIIPNRLLTNNYSQMIRKNLMEKTEIFQIVDFSTDLEIFPNANIHPCILVFKLSYPNTENAEYYQGSYIKSIDEISQFNLWKITKCQVPYRLVQRYNLFFTNLSNESLLLLDVISQFPPLGSNIRIHEATRLARFQHRFAPEFPIRVTSKDWEELDPSSQSIYIREIRGEEIVPYILKNNKYFLTLPELQSKINVEQGGNQSISKSSKQIQEVYQPKLFIRELGKSFFIAYDLATTPSIGYGGVYYITPLDLKDLDSNNDQINLFGYLSYFASHFSLSIYRILFTAGSWGDALKFRSNYMHQLPYISISQELCNKFGFILYWFSNQQTKNLISIETIKMVSEKIIHYLDLIYFGYTLTKVLENPISITLFNTFISKLSDFNQQNLKLSSLYDNHPTVSANETMIKKIIQEFKIWSDNLEKSDQYQQVVNQIENHPIYSIIEK